MKRASSRGMSVACSFNLLWDNADLPDFVKVLPVFHSEIELGWIPWIHLPQRPHLVGSEFSFVRYHRKNIFR